MTTAIATPPAAAPFAIATSARRPSADGRAWVRRVGDMHVLKVAGSFYDMGRQHGELLRDEVRRGPLPYFRTYVERLLGQTVGPLSHVIWPSLKHLVGGRIRKAIPPFALESLTGLADGADLPLDDILDGCVMPDSLMWAAAKSMKLGRHGPAVQHRSALGFGCTSAIAWGEATADGRLLHARNFDYHGVEAWPRQATVIFHDPDEGQRYVSMASAGVLLGGGTAMNEAGLSLTVHQHMFTDRTQLGGTPIGIIGDVVMRKAESLADAERILGEHDPIGCWTYLVTDAKTREVLCWEESPERQVAIRSKPEDSTFAYSNIYLDPELGSTEINLYGSYWRHNEARYRRTSALLREGHGQLDPDGMAAILGDTGEGNRCRIRGAIAMLLTVGSVIFRPEDGVLWIAAGETPTSQRPFVPFSFDDLDHAPEHGVLTGGIPGADQTDAAEAFAAYRAGYVAYFEEDDIARAREHVERARTIKQSEALYHAVAGLLALRDGDAEVAFGAFSEALSLRHPDPERRASHHLWRARAADATGRRASAMVDYEAVLGMEADPPVRKAAERGARRPWAKRRGKKIVVDFTFADVVSP